jgi:hypothetical protein
MNKKKQDLEKLYLWQDRLAQNDLDEYRSNQDARENIYNGSTDITQIIVGDKTLTTPHIRNIAAELIESQVNSTIPQPKVTARRQEDEDKAKLIEDMLRNELDRMPFEEINDMIERTVPIQGGGFYLVEWDNSERTHTTVGELIVTPVHPKQFVGQDGVYTSIEDMDYIILKYPQTKEYIRRRYGVSVEQENESEMDIRGVDAEDAPELVTQYIAYYRNDNGGIGLFSWVVNTILEDIEDYQARRLRKCTKCGQREALDDVVINKPTLDGNIPDDAETVKPKKGVCSYCGNKEFTDEEAEFEEVYEPYERDGKIIIPGSLDGTPVKIPYYKPNVYPVVLQKNVSVFGQLLGESDIDKISTQQNTTNRLEAKIIDKLLKAGSYLCLPEDATIRVDSEELKVIRPPNAASKGMIDVYNLEANITQDMDYLNQIYEESRQIIGVTDSFQGRKDTTATSGVAKEFAAAQSAGRLESKRVMKEAAYAKLFEIMFKYKLAYSDEPRPVVTDDIHGNKQYKNFNKYDFLERDEAGEYYWNDQFLFGCDATAPLANNREAMWQENRLNLQTGAYGDPAKIETLILFWQRMALLHYPGAEETKKFLEEEQIRQQQQMQQTQMMAQQGQAMQGQQRRAEPTGEEAQAVINKAFMDAQMQMGGNQ